MSQPFRPSLYMPSARPTNQERFRSSTPASSPSSVSPASAQGQVRPLRTAQMAARLNRSRRTVRYWCEIGFLPAYKPGRREWFVDEEDFISWLEKRKEVED
jgi:excisionase family DNA binding protein